jgi:hypothetical protein
VLYLARSLPLEVGKSVEIARYFKPPANPVVLRVLGRDTIEAAGRRWSTLVVQPIIKTSTMFGDGQARVWLSDDSARVIVRLNAKASIGSITMTLRSLSHRSESVPRDDSAPPSATRALTSGALERPEANSVVFEAPARSATEALGVQFRADPVRALGKRDVVPSVSDSLRTPCRLGGQTRWPALAPDSNRIAIVDAWYFGGTRPSPHSNATGRAR